MRRKKNLFPVRIYPNEERPRSDLPLMDPAVVSILWKLIPWGIVGGVIFALPPLYASYVERKFPRNDWPAILGYVLLFPWFFLVIAWVLYLAPK